MKLLEAMECPYDQQMQQQRHIIQGDSRLSYEQMETTSFLMSAFHESRHKSLIAHI